MPLPKGDHALGFTMRWPGKHYCVGPGSRIGEAEYRSNGKAIAELPRAWVEAIVADCARPGATESGDLGGYRPPDHVAAGGRYAAVRDYVASRYKRGLSRAEIWTLVKIELAPRFEVPLSEDQLRDQEEARPSRDGPCLFPAVGRRLRRYLATGITRGLV